MGKSDLTRKKIKTFNYYKVLDDYYLEDGIGFIPVKVKSIDDIISPYSTKNSEILNYEFMRYIDINANFIPWGYPLTLEIHGPKFSDKEKRLIAKVLKNHYSLLLVNKKEEMKDLRKRGLYLIIMGVVSFIIYLLLMYFNVNYAPIELMAFLFWLALWEGFDAEILSPDDIKDEIKDLEYLSNMNIIYEDEESDDII